MPPPSSPGHLIVYEQGATFYAWAERQANSGSRGRVQSSTLEELPRLSGGPTDGHYKARRAPQISDDHASVRRTVAVRVAGYRGRRTGAGGADPAEGRFAGAAASAKIRYSRERGAGEHS